jgi:hypothetical protein
MVVVVGLVAVAAARRLPARASARAGGAGPRPAVPHTPAEVPHGTG